jgi:hypothetical protein
MSTLLTCRVAEWQTICVIFKWEDFIGTGWRTWRSLLKSANFVLHTDPDFKSAAKSVRQFSIDLLGVASFLVTQHDDVYGKHGTRADEWLLRFAFVRNEVRRGRYDKGDAKGDAKQTVDGSKFANACSLHSSMTGSSSKQHSFCISSS